MTGRLYKSLKNTVVVKSSTPERSTTVNLTAKCESEPTSNLRAGPIIFDYTDTHICKDIKINETIKFQAEIELTDKDFCTNGKNTQVKIIQ